MQHDAIIVGGSFAGLAGALLLARTRRRVLVIDAGKPRNRFATHSHGVLGHDGRAGSDLLAEARAQFLAYPSASFVSGEAIAAETTEEGVTVSLADGTRQQGRRMLIATGVRDDLPAIPGLVERWGKTVLHCPYCHAYEIGGGPIGVFATTALSHHQASLLADWGDTIYFASAEFPLDDASTALLAARKVRIEDTPFTAVEGPAPAIDGVRLADGRLVPVKALFIGAPLRMASPLAQQIGCAFDETRLGVKIRTDGFKQTTVRNVFAAGDAATEMHNITLASADGALAALSIHRSLIEEDAANAMGARAA
ncbi:NAD(P)/FAD-dependent oxidoreductase [Aminobacter aganoensis]|uniref:Thioredoxin reductase n=1 Tax=Aminobacter aganoensis TaxID=83264 RepID=A0A7X0F553_9HYPH|nr:NAD(P)/FAD-dependent oxidoreductase [Aminobacter aganoensis]MBB6353274.1 thioredoxin reductase [Aminobacter aganoensis]